MFNKSNINFHKRLVFQISFFVVIVSLITISYLSIYFSHKQSQDASNQLRHQAIVLAENLAAASSAYVITRNYSSIEEILVRSAKFENISSLQIFDIHMKTLGNVVKAQNSEIKPEFSKNNILIPNKSERSISQDSQQLEIINPIILGDIVGWVRVVYSLDKINKAKTEIWKNNIQHGFFITIFTVFILIYLLRKPVISIKKYTEFADSLNEYNGDVVSVDKRSVETRKLGTALNRASIDLFDHHEKLQETLADIERVAAIAEHSTDIVLSIGSDYSIKYINSTGKKVLQNVFLSEDDKHIKDILPTNFDSILYKCLSDNAPQSNIESFTMNHTFLWKFSPLSIQDVVHCHAIDITDKKLAEEKLVYQANYDLLTGLPNKVLALDRLNQAIINSKRQKYHIALMCLDVDNFKKVNDTLGHIAGDKIIQSISKRLSQCIRDGDTLARFGADVFLIILSNLNTPLDSKVVAEKIIKIMSDEFQVDEQKFHLSMSIGITSYPVDDEDTNSLVRNADTAMHKAKEKGGNTFHFYSSEYNSQALFKVEMESQLRNALDHNELFLTYQPQIDIDSNKIIGAEALIRWNNEKFGLIAPDKFVPLAEESNLIISIGKWVLKTACQEASKWQSLSNEPLRVAVNVSARQFSEDNFPKVVKNILSETNLPPCSLELEITESLLIEDDSNLLTSLDEIKKIGVKLALDDFGTGYSSLSYLKRFPFDILKIDRAFVTDVMDNSEDAALCKAIVAIASSLKLDVIGEGVETSGQLSFLKSIGADIAQGYYYSKPLKPKSFIEFVENFSI